MDQIEKMYRKFKYDRLKSVIRALAAYFIMIVCISFCYGKYLENKYNVYLNEKFQLGWLESNWYLILLCIIIAFIAGLLPVIIKLISEGKLIDCVLMDNCDSKKYLEITKCAIDYRNNHHVSGWQKAFFTLNQLRYVTALITNGLFDEADDYIDTGWIGKKNKKTIEEYKINIKLNRLVRENNAEEYNKVFDNASKTLKNSKINIGTKLYLNKKFDECIKLLLSYREKNQYGEVSRHYLLGLCYKELEDEMLMIENMIYVVNHGNTMDYVNTAKQLLEQKI